MRVVLDTNVLMSGIFWSGPAHRILTAWSHGKFKLLISLAVFDEYREIIKRLSAKYKIISANSILNDIFIGSELVEPSNASIPSCEDPDDIMFLELAVAGKAEYLVSGDKHLLKLIDFPNGKIVNPSDFLNLLSSTTGKI